MAKLFRKILVPHDFSLTATHALKVAFDLAYATAGRVTALHVLTPFYSGPGYPTQDEIAWTPPAEMLGERQHHLEALVQKALGGDPQGDLSGGHGEAVQAILDAAKDADVM